MTAPFHSAGWVHTTNIYEVNLRQYTHEGSFGAFSRELPRLRDMGIEVLWFMPITPISVSGRKGTLGSYYACSDYTSTNPEFGSLDDFRQLVRRAHELGFRVIIDWVVNHTGLDHRWTREHPDYYRKNHEGHFYEAHGWEDVIDLNFDNPDLRQAVIGAMEFWIKECDIDGFRCDMAMLVPLEFWREARTRLDQLKGELFWLAECEEIAYHEVFDATYTWKFLHKMEAFWRKETGLAGLDEVLTYYNTMFPPDAMRAYFTSNHDENSHSGSEYERMGDAARIFSVLCCTWQGLPLIYSGQELPNYKRLKFFDKDFIEWKGPEGDGAAAANGTEYGTNENGPGETAENRANKTARWAESCQLHSFYKTLLELRKRNPALRAGDPAVHTERLYLRSNDRDRCFAFIRKMGEQAVLVVLNFSAAPLFIPVDQLPLSGGLVEGGSDSEGFQDVFSGKRFGETGRAEGTEGNTNTIELGPWGFGVYEKK